MRTLFLIATLAYGVVGFAQAQPQAVQPVEPVAVVPAPAAAQAVPQQQVVVPVQPKTQTQIPAQAQVTTTAVETATVAPAPTAQAPVQAQPVYIMNQPQVGQQPATVIEASPLNESKAEEIRKEREQAEMNTESQIEEKLEESRLQDEKNRAQRLFGNALDSNQQQTATQAPQAAAQPAAPAAQQVTPEEVKAEIQKELNDEKPHSKTYASGLAGAASYPNAVNVTGHDSYGATFGVMFPKRLSFEGFVIYSSYDVNPISGNYGYYNYYNYSPYIRSVDQYNLGGAVKYDILASRISPVIGALGSYTYRTYTDNSGYNGSDSTQAFDVGALIGLDFFISDTFSIGADYRYFTNLANWSNNSVNSSFIYGPSANFRPLESINYQMWTVNARFAF